MKVACGALWTSLSLWESAGTKETAWRLRLALSETVPAP